MPNKNQIKQSDNDNENWNNNVSEKEEDKKPNKKEEILNKRFIVLDKDGNQIYIEGNILLAMEI